MRRRAARAALGTLLIVLAAAAWGALWVRGRLHASLPVLDGQVTLAGLQAPVAIGRDALGIPTIQASSRRDLARATGFLHAQDRFFEMDLARRRAAGELAELVGRRALAVDRQTRLHRFRSLARRTIAGLSEPDRSILSAYTEGVNAGLSRLGERPFEYLMLRQPPRPWLDEDTILVVLSMFLTLQDSEGAHESTLATMHELLPPAMVDFLAPEGTEWDTPIAGETFGVPPIPGPEVYNLRARRQGKSPVSLPPKPESVLSGVARGEAPIGSNNFAVAGHLTVSGRALLASDMHLAVRVPNTWYRATFVWTDAARTTHTVAGVTLPGHPAMVIGSNEHVAWGFTTTYADVTDIVMLDTDPSQPDRYRTPDGWKLFEHHDEVIKVAGAPDERLAVTTTIWGPVIDPDFRGRPRALRWVAHSLDRQATTVTPLETATTLEDAFAAANGLAAPAQNMIAADSSGRVGWSIFGALPRRTGMDGALPVSWADGTRGWAGWLPAADYPRLIDPAGDRVWSANNRVAGGTALVALGHGNFEVGSRARIIRDRLMSRDRFEPRDLLAIQLDVSASFLARWRDLILRTLTPADLDGHADRVAFREIVNRGWTGKATADSAAYLFTRLFREQASERVMAFVLAACYEADRTFDYRYLRVREGPIWKLVTEQPQHLLDPAFDSWHALLVATVDEVIDRTRREFGRTLSERRWEEWNVTAYRHPLSGALPFLGHWLDMPAQPLDGDLYTPNVHWGAHAPSERMIVSPGHEAEGWMAMPAGQSGHPLSPFYANSHPSWVRGEMTPLLGGPAMHSLRLVP